jgi:Oxidoreductase family, C-terminal alpha/beta domain
LERRAPLPATATRLTVSTDHILNFIDCVRSREKPICDANIGHRSGTVCHIGNIAIRTGESLRRDPKAERFVGADRANAMLSREMRSPWTLEG